MRLPPIPPSPSPLLLQGMPVSFEHQDAEALKAYGAINYVFSVKSWKSVVSDIRPEELYDVDRLRFDIY